MPLREVMAGELVEDGLRLGGALQPGGDVSEHAAVQQRRGELVRGSPHLLLEALEPSPLATQHERLEPARDCRVPALGTLPNVKSASGAPRNSSSASPRRAAAS